MKRIFGGTIRKLVALTVALAMALGMSAQAETVL